MKTAQFGHFARSAPSATNFVMRKLTLCCQQSLKTTDIVLVDQSTEAFRSAPAALLISGADSESMSRDLSISVPRHGQS